MAEAEAAALMSAYWSLGLRDRGEGQRPFLKCIVEGNMYTIGL